MVLEQEKVEEFRQEAMVQEIDGTFYLTMHGSRFEDRWGHWLKRPFDPMNASGIDDGDPHYLG